MPRALNKQTNKPHVKIKVTQQQQLSPLKPLMGTMVRGAEKPQLETQMVGHLAAQLVPCTEP